MVELASMLAGERFTDRPRCVCRVIAAYLRAFNDRVGYATRQRLYPYAARSVNTRGGRRLLRARRDLCLQWLGYRLDSGGALGRGLTLLVARMRIAVTIGLLPALFFSQGAAEYAARRAVAARDVDGALELLDALLALGGDGSAQLATPLASPPKPPAAIADAQPAERTHAPA